MDVYARYKSGPFREVTMLGIGDRNARALELSEGHANFRKLKGFLKDIRVEVPGDAPVAISGGGDDDAHRRTRGGLGKLWAETDDLPDTDKSPYRSYNGQPSVLTESAAATWFLAVFRFSNVAGVGSGLMQTHRPPSYFNLQYGSSHALPKRAVPDTATCPLTELPELYQSRGNPSLAVTWNGPPLPEPMFDKFSKLFDKALQIPYSAILSRKLCAGSQGETQRQGWVVMKVQKPIAKFVSYHLRVELDFVQEAENESKTTKLIAAEPRLAGRLHIPLLYPKLSNICRVDQRRQAEQPPSGA
ncbi:hypothetical protein FIBSPDRAFT_963330 [Athelia psychrophila]|uniref:Uncharacterized protein n=1 Tax=Athelia psychrophila TaxID=1759441 RepID=A0A165Z1W9_9AGAM|nr:hypothetical protein FIBSPDRAFT_963330 [Fibularhizoctonia sp. CBS 109695]